MRLVQFLNTIKEQPAERLYHGVNTTVQAEHVLKYGIEPPVHDNPRSFFAPIQGRVYLTPSINYGIIYALGGVVAGYEDPRDHSENPYGYLFIVNQDDFLDDVWPDEDSVGEAWMLANMWKKGEKESIRKYWGKDPIGSIVFDNDQVRGWLSTWSPGGVHNMSPKMYNMASGGEAMWHAKLGKMMLQKMPDHIKQAFIDAGVSVSMKGTIKPSEAWRIDKRRGKELKGGNFFQIAEKIPLRISEQQEPSEREKLFNQTARAQRGEPEHIMVEIQFAIGGGVMNFVIEHVGDLTHRMTQDFDFLKGQHDIVQNKVEKTLRTLTHGYGFEREHLENLRNNYRYYAEEKGEVPGGAKTFEEYKAYIDGLLLTYADAHRKVPVYNKLQRLARQAAVMLGVQKIDEAILYLYRLSDALKDQASYVKAAGEITMNEATVYHGSPHQFSKFDISKLGTGEGFQKYGYGLYFAENPAVAETYLQHAPGGTGLYMYTVEIPDTAIERMLDWDASINQQSNEIQQVMTQRAEAKKEKIMDAALEDFAENSPMSASQSYFEDLVDELVRYGGYGPNGSNVLDYLKEMAPNTDWDEVVAMADDFDPEVDTGQHIYSALTHDLGSEEAASKWLLEYANVPGIKYLDAGSRTSSGTRNVVLFDSNLARIVDVDAIGEPVEEDMDNAAFLSQDNPGMIAAYPLPKDSTEYRDLNTRAKERLKKLKARTGK